MSKLSAEERAELDALEDEARLEREAETAAAERMHLEAMRLRKKHASKDKKHGRDYAVVETKIGVFAVRKPLDTEIDTVSDTPDDRGAQEKFALQVLLEPGADVVRGLFADNPGLAPALSVVAIDLAKVRSAEDAKK